MQRIASSLALAALAAVGIFTVPSAVLAQSFNGAGRISPGSPTGWAPNPNIYQGTGYANTSLGGAYRPGYQNGYYTGLGTAPVYPFGTPYINPVAAGNGFYSFNGGGVAANLWRAPSGYYYPFNGRGGGYNQIIYVDQSQGQAQTVQQLPPLSMQFTDMGQYLDDSKKNNKLTDNEYQSLKRRLTDIHSKERSLRIAGGGQLSEEYDAEIRQNLNDFSREMVERVKI